MVFASNIFADNDLSIYTAHEIGDALWANRVHGNTHNDPTNCLDELIFKRMNYQFGVPLKFSMLPNYFVLFFFVSSRSCQ